MQHLTRPLDALRILHITHLFRIDLLWIPGHCVSLLVETLYVCMCWSGMLVLRSADPTRNLLPAQPCLYFQTCGPFMDILPPTLYMGLSMSQSNSSAETLQQVRDWSIPTGKQERQN
ncbi:uncharacterized protein MCYG_03724 [Microsporum canis CBS 113480]|uniref:Uncharacterized protein n=1 Tax=Arthroderma otae (strain ATCC MYA-4605 / CBS 113480) TaxID=554155 RepID=C5FJP4_ARTOC|nr:uncharacterized protein MCYG_03724 [Microsporum canis CBS 113480]EEQ30905.1 predicted protein [Microsporum canis CBS 113480]